jgi:crotonobetainyl-CoA:carnitine CoA-transferase CaiB-like acyl-CoA transferase
LTQAGQSLVPSKWIQASIDILSALRHSRRTGQGEKLDMEAALGLIFYAEFCRNVIAQRKKRVRTAR